METGDPSRPYERPATDKYPSSGVAATPLFDRILRPLLKSEGSIPFSRFMELALYQEEFGYYSDPARTRVTLVAPALALAAEEAVVALAAAAEAGAVAVIQPGGSMRDQEVIDAANENGLAMVFTGMRHFRH